MGIIKTTNFGNINIRIAKTNDAKRIKNLRLEALASDPSAFAADYDISAKETAEKWIERIKENTRGDKGVICVAENDSQIIGMCGIQRGHWPKTRHSAYIWGVYVNQTWRGHQIAQAMIETCCSWGKEHGIVIAKLGVSTLNQAAIRCYTHCGFTTYGTEPKALYYEDAYIDEFLMVKDL